MPAKRMWSQHGAGVWAAPGLPENPTAFLQAGATSTRIGGALTGGYLAPPVDLGRLDNSLNRPRSEAEAAGNRWSCRSAAAAADGRHHCQ